MDNNENFSIDDILSEVKKRREENELQLKGDENQPKEASELSFKADEEPQPVEEAPEKEAADSDFSINELKVTHDDNAEVEEPDLVFENDDESEDELIEEESVDDAEAEVTEEEDPTDEPADESDNEEPEADDEEAANGMVDLLKLANEPVAETVEEAPAKKKLSKKAKIIIAVLAVLIVCAGIFAGVYINNILSRVTNDPNAEDYQMTTYYDGMDFLQENFPTINEPSAYDIYDYKDYLKKWYQNGDPVSSTHILNVLLIGEDTREAQISDTSRADSAIIASINIDTGEIHLTSILRDLYVYYEVDGEGYYGKINEAASRGGMHCYIKTLERYYKIAINNYAVVNFASFPKIIDSLGGVNIKLTTSEIYEINNHPKRYGGVTINQTFEGSEGYMTLNGTQSLAYCRIRKIDSDNARADRQKNVLKALLKKMQKAGKLDTVKVVNQLSGYVYTGYNKKDLIGIGNTALKDGWLDFEIKSRNVPRLENCRGGQKFSVAPNNWIWLADIPKDAYQLQMEIYGKSNIVLNENRADYIALGR